MATGDVTGNNSFEAFLQGTQLWTALTDAGSNVNDDYPPSGSAPYPGTISYFDLIFKQFAAFDTTAGTEYTGASIGRLARELGATINDDDGLQDSSGLTAPYGLTLATGTTFRAAEYTGNAGQTLDGSGVSTTAIVSTGRGADTITGSNQDDVISAGDGNDQIIGSAGQDYIKSGLVRDTINGGNDDD